MVDTPSEMEQVITRAERTQTLDGEIEYFLSHGWRLRSKTPTDAVLVKGEPINHGVHIFFSIVTLGLWLLVYVPLLIFGGEKHKRLSVDESGRVTSA